MKTKLNSFHLSMLAILGVGVGLFFLNGGGGLSSGPSLVIFLLSMSFAVTLVVTGIRNRVVGPHVDRGSPVGLILLIGFLLLVISMIIYAWFLATANWNF